MQEFVYLDGEDVGRAMFPAADAKVLGGVKWGSVGDLLTPAFWASRMYVDHEIANSYALGDTFEEEVIACVLGGFGLPAEVGLAAYRRVVAEYSVNPSIMSDVEALEAMLYEPLDVNGRRVRYRFWRQKARYLVGIFEFLNSFDHELLSDSALRDMLCLAPGVGPKTASWIVRNWRKSDEVAILDIHIIRACQGMCLFPSEVNLSAGYHKLEKLFLDFSKAIAVPASKLDAIIWKHMKLLGAIART